MHGFYLEPGPEANRTPMSLYGAHCRMMRDRNPNYYEEELRAERQINVPPLRYPWIDLTPGAKAEAGRPAIKHPHKKSSAVVVSVKILGEVVVMCLRPVLAFAALLVKRLVATGTQAETESVVENPNSASSATAASPVI
ncbi:hypothetical protein HanXRQr2_Chr11g0500411 [Helianthus annuus]|uniref:Uncharacterized protein n=2 Tax=Helianthus annuus TaxID=4232 RepID=A0A251TAD3_HELAN|nr:hypothetical protein HanXRQr2_Chr11g0500411 [Helianthus annuus]KAJ0875907.1 hypothetical protein HanPSC8_Chr11g0482091 [Helianthus annuus]